MSRIIHLYGQSQTTACGTWHTAIASINLVEVTCRACKNTALYKNGQEWYRSNVVEEKAPDRDPRSEADPMTPETIRESTVARIAGNLLSGHARLLVNDGQGQLVPDQRLVAGAVRTARAIVAEVQRTEPTGGEQA